MAYTSSTVKNSPFNLTAFGSVLVTDGLWRKTLSVVRALGRANCQVSVMGDDFFTTSFFSKYCHRKIVAPSAEINPKRFFERLILELQSRPYDLLIPMEDATIEILLRNRKEVERYTRLPLPRESDWEKARDKGLATEMARRMGVPIPHTYEVHSLSELDEIAWQAKYPLLIKPRQSSGSRGILKISNPQDLREHYTSIHSHYPYPLLQEAMPHDGAGYGVGLLFDTDHEPVAGFVHKRLREYPVKGGPSTLRESVVDPVLLDQSIRLLKQLNWVGVAMVEYKLDIRDGRKKFLEINPRFWGSLELANVAGVNFPVLLHQVMHGQPVSPRFDYPEGRRCRWLIPGDILHFLSNPKRFHLDPSFFNFFDRNTKYDEFASDDIGGSLGSILATAIHAFNPRMWKKVFRPGIK